MLTFWYREHLGRPAPVAGEERDFEEEFYYTEVEPEADSFDEVTATYFTARQTAAILRWSRLDSDDLIYL